MLDELPRTLPPLDEVQRPFWTGGSNGTLLITRCQTCQRWQHPPAAACAACGARTAPEPVSGQGTIFTFTVNRHAFNPLVPPPYVIALIELDEQADLRLITNIVDCDDPDGLHCGQPVEVRFAPHGLLHVPVFRPTSGGGQHTGSLPKGAM